MEALQRTPLHAFHLARGARMVPFAGWEMPVQYTSILEEHRAVRAHAGLFDVSHMGEIQVTGKEATAFLNRLLTNDVRQLAPGRALYTAMCYPDGGVVDDLIVYQRAEDDYLLVVNASNLERDLEWMDGKVVEYNCRMDDVSAAYGLLAVQGPAAPRILEQAGLPLEDLARFALREVTWEGAPVLLSRTGYTGEDGAELFVPADRAAALADHLMQVGGAHGLVPAGLGARDSLRLEAGYPLYGHELSARITPLQAGLGWVVKLGKRANFYGKEALTAEKAAGPRRRVVWFRLPGRRIAREGTPVLAGTREVGRVLSGSLSPLTGAPIGSALVESEFTSGPLEVDLRGTQVALELARPPLHHVS
ncbi:MAG: glycine cleavage system aminomethyltransferase GcvT [Opitutales bacterium]